MSKRSNQFRLRRQFGAVLVQKEDEPTRVGMVQGDGAGTVKVPNKPRYIYIRQLGRTRFEECLNIRTPIRYDLPVVVGYLHELPGVLQVLDVDWARITGPGDYAYMPSHHESHELLNDEGGDDVVWVQSQQILPLLVYPTDPPSMFVNVFGGWYPWDTGWHYFENAISADLTGNIPPNVGEARFVLICIDGATETLHYESGDIFPQFLPPVDCEDRIPVPPSGKIPLAAIYFVGGMTTIEWENTYDLRLSNQPIGGSVSPGPHSLLDPTVHDDTSLDSPTRGSLIYGNPPTGTFSQWDEFLIGVTGTFLGSTGVEPVWTTAPPPGPHAILSAIHSDAAVQAVSRGSLIVGNAVWDELPIGATGTYLRSTGLDPVWSSLSPHNELTGLQGGVAGEYYHFTQAQHTSFTVVAAAGYALVSTGANVWGADLTPAWLGPHTWTSAAQPLLSINPGFVGTGIVVEITPSAAITTIDAAWDGISIDGALLDPAVVDVDLHAIHVKFSGIAVGNLPHIDAIHIETPVGYHREFNHALHTEGGGIWMDWDGSTITVVDNWTINNVVVQVGAAAAGMIHAYDVAIAGAGTVVVAALGTHTGVSPVHQHVGTYQASAKAWEENGGFAEVTAAFAGAPNVEIFSGDNDYIYISGDAAANTFDEIQVVLTINANKSIKPVFEFSTGGPGWTQFYPTDDTHGFQHNGTIRFQSADLVTAGWAVQNVNAEGVNRFWIRIQRTRNNLGTAPTEATIKVLAATLYYWDDSGDISIHNVTVVAGVDFIGASGANEITVPDNTAIALELLDAGGLEYMRIVSTDANPYFLIDPAGAGIFTGFGTAAPGTVVEIHGAHVGGKGLVYVVGTTHAFISLDAATDSNSGIMFRENNVTKWALQNDGDDGDKLELSDDGDIRMMWTQAGEVGIGTPLPSDLLEVYKDQAAPTRITINNPNAGGKAALLFKDGGVFQGWLEYDNSTLDLVLQNWNNAAHGNVVINPVGGNVGIRTTTPLVPLEVWYETASTTGEQGVINLGARSTGNMADGFGPRILAYIDDATSANTFIAQIGFVRDGADDSGKIIFGTRSAGAWGGSRVTIDKDGNVKIASLAGAGVRAVVAAADGTLSAP